VRDFNTPLTPTDRSSEQKINKEILELNHIIDQMDLKMSIEHFIQHPHKIHSNKQTMELSPKLIISYGTKQASVNIRK
jgi:hypothetical protein